MPIDPAHGKNFALLYDDSDERARRLLSLMQEQAEHVLAARDMRREITESIARRISDCEL